MASGAHFHPPMFDFLRQLARNNNRDWFNANKQRYEQDVKRPALRFIEEFAPHLAKISRNFVADTRPVGGSLFRIYRDTRFSRDKRPYKTAVGIQFRHRQAKDVHAPGFYLHLEPGNVFAGAGIWHPGGSTLKMLRDTIVEHPTRWKRVTRAKPFAEWFALSGDSLKRAPRGYDPEHPLLDDLKRRDLVGFTELDEGVATADGFLQEYARICRAAGPFVKFLCEAVAVPF
jgi:uncharacterized protein (TIGR02453 family)